MEPILLCVYLGASIFAIDANGALAVPVAGPDVLALELENDQLTVYAGERSARGTTVTLNGSFGSVASFLTTCELAADDHAADSRAADR